MALALLRGQLLELAIAELASGNDLELVSDCLGIEEAKWLPPRPLLDLGAWYITKQRFSGVGKDR